MLMWNFSLIFLSTTHIHVVKENNDLIYYLIILISSYKLN